MIDEHAVFSITDERTMRVIKLTPMIEGEYDASYDCIIHDYAEGLARAGHAHPDVPGAPPIPGLSFRRFRGEADYPIMVSIMDACNEVDRLEYINTVEEIAHVFSHLTNCDPYRDMLFADVNGETVAFSRVWWTQEDDGCRLYKALGFVHPTWRRKGLGAAMLRYNEDRLRAIAGTHPAGEKRFRTWATDREFGALALFARFGYESVRHYVEMVRSIDAPLPAAPMPQGLEVRPTCTRVWATG